MEWVLLELERYEKEEREAIKHLSKAQDEFTKIKTELASVKENLAGIRGGIAEFKWQKEFLEEHGRLP
jgi:predicted  nucleic acid-binding Zn-ribbon protein